MPVKIRPLPHDLTQCDADRFWSSVITGTPEQCWYWKRCLTPNGYGRFTFAQKWFMATRVAFRFTYGADPYPCYVLHRCDNPLCCNPDHLFLGTHADNMSDGAKKNRFASGDKNGQRTHPETNWVRSHPETTRGENNGRSKLTADDVRLIRTLWSNGTTSTDLARMFGITDSCAWNAATRRSWKHLT